MEEVITDGKSSKQKIIQSIALAKNSVRIAMAYFTDKEIANSLLKINRLKNVDIELILSDSSTNTPVINLLRDEIRLGVFESSGRGIMHHKFCIIDGQYLLHGSYNYTYNATNNNEESLNVTDSRELISRYEEIFLTLADDSTYINKESHSSTDMYDTTGVIQIVASG